MTNLEHKQNNTSETPSGSDPLLLRLSPHGAQELRDTAAHPEYDKVSHKVQSYLAQKAFELGRLDTGGFGIVEDPTGRHYISLFPEDLGQRLDEESARNQGLPELVSSETTTEVASTPQPEEDEGSAAEVNVNTSSEEPERAVEGSGQEENKAEAAEQPVVAETSNETATGEVELLPSRTEISDEAEAKANKLSDRLLRAMEVFASSEMQAAIDEFKTGENRARDALMALRNVINQFEYKQISQNQAGDMLEAEGFDLKALYDRQAQAIGDRIRIPVQKLKDSIESELAPDTNSFIQGQIDEGVNTDVGRLSYLKEDIKSGEDISGQSWENLTALEGYSDSRVLEMYGLNALISEFKTDHWGIETIIAQLKAKLDQLDDGGYMLSGRLAVIEENVNTAKSMGKVH